MLENLFAKLLAVLATSTMRHFDAKLVHLAGEVLWALRHPAKQASFAKQLDSLEQREGNVFKKHPVNRIMNICLQTCAIKKGQRAVHWIFQTDRLAAPGPGRNFRQTLMEKPHLFLRKKVQHPVHFRFREASDTVDLEHPTEIGQKFAAVNGDRKSTVGNASEHRFQDVRPERFNSLPRMPDLGITIGVRCDFLQIFQRHGYGKIFESRGNQRGVRLFDDLFELLEILIGRNRNKSWTQEALDGNLRMNGRVFVCHNSFITPVYGPKPGKSSALASFLHF